MYHHLRRRISRPLSTNLPRPQYSSSTTADVRPIKLKALALDHAGRRDPVSDPSPGRPFSSPMIPLPTSPNSLYRNLLSITSNPTFSTSKAINYYFDWPKTLHSAKSFNLLISLALRNTSFASVRRLFAAMQAESIPPNMETWKLHLRWLIRTGKWNDAWKRVFEITRNQNLATKSLNNPIPLPLWLELFGSQKRGALRHWVVNDRSPNPQAGSAVHRIPASAVFGTGYNTRRDSAYDVHLDAGREGGKASRADVGVEANRKSIPVLRKRLMPRPCLVPYAFELSRYRALMQVSPLLSSSSQVQILPRTILLITRVMYQVGQRNLALSTALSYLESLPPRLRRCDRRRILDLVNFHLFMAARHRKQGLKQHFTQRRILQKFLRVRPNLPPSSTTLFLVLGSLRGCRRGGTLAMHCLHLFEKRWGPRVQSRLVRRRVASLALKEGRLDVVEAMIKLERRRASKDFLPWTVHTSRRRPWGTLFSRRGAENRRWHMIEEKYRRRLMLRSGSQG